MSDTNPPAMPTASKEDKPRQRHRFWKVLFASLGVLAVAGISLFKQYTLPSSSMSPTIPRGAVIVTKRFSYWFGEPRRGDIVTFTTQNIRGIEGDPGYNPRYGSQTLLVSERLNRRREFP